MNLNAFKWYAAIEKFKLQVCLACAGGVCVLVWKSHFEEEIQVAILTTKNHHPLDTLLISIHIVRAMCGMSYVRTLLAAVSLPQRVMMARHWTCCSANSWNRWAECWLKEPIYHKIILSKAFIVIDNMANLDVDCLWSQHSEYHTSMTFTDAVFT